MSEGSIRTLLGPIDVEMVGDLNESIKHNACEINGNESKIDRANEEKTDINLF